MTLPAYLHRFEEEQKCLDHGFVRLIDVMGDDAAVVQAARVSYDGKSKGFATDRKTMRYMLRHGHTSPYEMCEIKLHCKMPLFVARQWIRHRTACLAGDMPLSFDLPNGLPLGGPRHYPLTVQEVFDRWQPTRNEQRPDKQRNPLHKRERVQGMLLRCLNEETGEIAHTQVTDIWGNGEKEVWEADFADGSQLRATLDHHCFTDVGWLKLGEAIERRALFAGSGKAQAPERTPTPPSSPERWGVIPAYEGYEVSTYGRVRSWRNTQGNTLLEPRYKTPTPIESGHCVVSLSKAGRSRAFFVHHLVMGAFQGLPGEGEECRHLDGCPGNNVLNNLRWGTSLANHADRMAHGGHQRLARTWTSIVDVRLAGTMPTYDLEVAGPWHNFYAGGVVVHNSVNEQSGRYTILPPEVYTPERGRVGGKGIGNKQGTEGVLDDVTVDAFLANLVVTELEVRARYEEASESGVANELARLQMTLGQYTQWIWKIDLHNLMHFLRLRIDSHAQHEIQVYGQAIANIVQAWVPVAWEAFVDYKLEARSFSRMEIAALQAFVVEMRTRTQGDVRFRDFFAKQLIDAGADTVRERGEFMKLLGVIQEDGSEA